MSAGIHRNQSYSLREMPWHGLGYVADEPLTLAEIEERIDASYTYDLQPLSAVVGDGLVPIMDKAALIRTNTRSGEQTYVSTVGPDYQPHTSAQLAHTVDALLDAGVPIETLGYLGARGQRLYLTFRLPRDIVVGGTDVTGMYLFASTSFDGSSATWFRATGVRVVCSNTWAAGARSAVAGAAVRHTSLLDGKVQAIRETLDLAYAQADDMQRLADELLAVRVPQHRLGDYLETLFPANPAATTTRSETIAAGKRDAVRALLDSDTNAEFKGTAWGLWNATTEYLDHVARAADDDARLARILDGAHADIKTRAANLLLSV